MHLLSAFVIVDFCKLACSSVLLPTALYRAIGKVYIAAGLRARVSHMVRIAELDCVVTRAANFSSNALITTVAL
jgi:deoxyhypusine synthase